MNSFPNLNFAQINAAAMPRLRALVEEITGQVGRLESRELLIRNPRREDASIGSFSINLEKGVWSDFASGDGGSDPISLVAYLQGHDNQRQAARWLMERLQLQCAESNDGASTKSKAQASGFPRPVVPVPEDAPPPPPLRGEQARWGWRNAAGSLLKVTIRTVDSKRGKVIRPYTWCETAPGRFAWLSHDLDELRPLFGLDRLAARPDAPVLVTEGEKTALAAEALFSEVVAVTSGGANSAKKADWTALAGRDVTICPDADVPGQGYALAVEAQARKVGVCSLRRMILPQGLPEGWDLADPVPPNLDMNLRALLDAAVVLDLGATQAQAGTTEPSSLPIRVGCYLIHEGKMCVEKQEIPHPLCNFVARIQEELVLDDGESEDYQFLVDGTLCDGTSLPVARVPASAFPGLRWIMSSWGARAIVNAGVHAKDQLRAAIQHLSRPSPRRAFLATGWRKVNGHWVYLHAGGAIGADGPLAGVEMDLRGRLSLFCLSEPLHGSDLAAAFRSSLRMLDLGPGAVTAPVWLSAFRAVVDECPFSIHISGTMSQGKTELASIAAGHFGTGLGAKTPLEAWESTPSALERTLFLAKDALGVVDDFRPGESSQARQEMSRKADRILRGAYNRASRSRLSSDARTQKDAYWARGLILSTGEDLPDGESLKSRVLMLEWPAGAMRWDILSGLQADRERGLHAGLMAAFIQWQAQDRERVLKLRREAHAEACRRLRESGENNRTGDIAADLWSVWPVLATFAREHDLVSMVELESLGQRLWASILAMSGAQAAIISEANPVERFKEGLTSFLASGRGHFANGELGDFPPEWHSRCGWQDSEPKGIRLGYLAPRKGEVWLIPAVTHQESNRVVPLGVGERALWKRLQEAGWLVLERPGRNKARRSLPDGGRPEFIVIPIDRLWGGGQSPALGQSDPFDVPS